MQNLLALSLNGNKVVLDSTQLDEFKNNLRGHLVTPHDDNYSEVRKVWNAMIDRRPALIVRCAGAADVMQAVKFARQHNLLTTTRGGGHNVGGLSLCDDAMLIDLSLMNSVRVD